MTEERKIEMLDILVVLVRKKFLLLFVAVLTAALGYLSVYYFIDEKFESTAVVVPYESGKSGGMSSLLKNISGLPIGGLSNLGGSTSNLDFYLTIVYSRSTLTEIIDKFDLRKEYDQKYFADVLKRVIEDITVVNNDDLSVSVAVRNKSPKKAADIANYIVDVLNKKVLEINTRKTKDNRIFLEKRYKEVVAELKDAEDRLEEYQKKNGVFEAEQQVKASVTAFADLEMELARKQVEYETAEKMLGENTPSVKNLKDALASLEKKVNDIKNGKNGKSVLIPMGSLPTKAIEYFRLYRDVKINSEMIEFLLPVYEQAKFDEQKEIPVILSIDKAVPSDKKVYPPRMVYAILISLFATGIIAFGLVMKEVAGNVSDPKVKFVLRNILSIRRKED
ncbi:MAG: hypothetical protein J0L60_05305 [Ignavibacteria bacterium]|nr:hypothetical protein [Ignavibacteria bacterium]